MRIREARNDDLRAILDVFFLAVHVLGRDHYTEKQLAAWAPPNPDADRWRAHLAHLQVWLAETDDRVIGFAGYGPAGHVDLLYVHPDSTRRGVATSLFKAMEQHARRSGAQVLETEASLVARPFFERQGFVAVGEEEVTDGGAVLRRLKMRKAFDSTQQVAPPDRSPADSGGLTP